MSTEPKRGRRRKKTIGINSDIRFNVEKFCDDVFDTLAVFPGSDCREWSIKKEWVEFTTIYFKVCRPRERYIRSSYDFFKKHENVIMSLLQEKTTYTQNKSEGNDPVGPGGKQVFDNDAQNHLENLPNKRSSAETGACDKGAQPSHTDETGDGSVGADSTDIQAQKHPESFENPSKPFSALCGEAGKSIGPYFNFPHVKSIEGSIFLVNCEGAKIIERGGTALEHKKSNNGFETKENESIVLGENTAIKSPIPNFSLATSSSNENSFIDNEGDAHLDPISDHSKQGITPELVPLSKKNLLDVNETSESQHVTITVDRQFSVEVNDTEWQNLFSLCTVNKNKQKVLPRNWRDHVARFLSERIPYCNIKFKRHKLYGKHSNHVAKFWFNCGIEGCSLDGSAVLDKGMVLHVNNQSTTLTHIKGKPKSFRSRFIRGEERLKLGKSVIETGFPSKEFHKRLSNLDEDYFLAGNLKNTPVSKNVLKQCAHEYRQSLLVDKDLVQSILMLKGKFISQLGCKTPPGFIQFFSVQPLTVALWTQTDIERFHKMSSDHCLLVDATGSLVTKISDKEIFYFAFLSYDRSVQTEPVAHIEILTELSTTNTLKFILMRFLENEMNRFNYTRHSVPLLCTSDVSWPIIKTFVGIFNNESIEEYLVRSYTILSGKATDSELPVDKVKTFVHISLCHVMKAFAKKANKCFKGDKNFIKFSLSLLANAFTYPDILDICKHFFTILLCKFSRDCKESREHLEERVASDIESSKKLKGDTINNSDWTSGVSETVVADTDNELPAKEDVYLGAYFIKIANLSLAA